MNNLQVITQYSVRNSNARSSMTDSLQYRPDLAPADSIDAPNYLALGGHVGFEGSHSRVVHSLAWERS